MNTLSKNILVSFLITLLCTVGLFAEDTQVDFDAAKIQINGLQATDPTLPSGVAQPKGRVGDILSKLFGADGKIGTRFLGIFTPGTTTINSVYISGATLTNVNATTLGGQTAAYYTNANNFTTGTFSGGLLPSTVVQTIGTQTITGAKTFTDTLVINKGASDTVQVGSSVYLQGGGSSFTQLQQGVGRFTVWGFNGSTWGEKMTINGTSGNIGIGTGSPTQKLDVVGNIKTSGDIMANRICTSGGTGCVSLPFTASSIDGGGTASYVARFTDGDTLGTGSIFDNGVRIGIGTTVPREKLDVIGNIIVGTGNLNNFISVNASNLADIGLKTFLGAAPQQYNLSTSSAGYFSITDTTLAGTPRLVVQNTSGNVGIGTVAPTSKLEVNGGVLLNNSTPTIGFIDTDTGADSYITANSTAGSIGIVADENNEIAGSRIGFNVDNTTTPKMVITSAGVGIGITTPLSDFHVGTTGDASMTSTGHIMTLGPVTGANLAIDNNEIIARNNGVGSNLFVQIEPGAGDTIFNTVSGNVGIGTGTPSYNLDINGTMRSLGNTYIENASPTTYYIDTNNRSAMAHVNSNFYYILRGSGVGSTTWATVNGRWPLAIDLDTNDATFGGAGDFLGSITAQGARPITLNPSGANAGDVSIRGDSGGWAFRYGALGSSGTDRGGFGFFGSANALTRYYIGTYNSDEKISILASNGNVGMGTISPVTPLDVRGQVNIDQGASYDVWIQGGSSTAAATRNLALLGVKSTDSLYLNYGGEYAGGTRIQGTTTYIDGDMVVNSAGSYPSINLGSDGPDRLYADNGASKPYGGGLWFRIGDGAGSYTDTLRLAENGNIGIGTSTPSNPLEVAGSIEASAFCNRSGANCKTMSQMSEPDAMVASGTALISAIQAAANLPSGSPASAVPDFWSYGGYYMINTKVPCTGRVEGGNITAPKRYHPIVKVNGTVSGTSNGFWWEDMEAVCLTRFWGPHEMHIKIKLEGNVTTIGGATGGFQWELWED